MSAAADLIAELRAILDRPNAAFFEPGPYGDCRCAWCEATRVAGFTCRACGFDGVPVVGRCECRQSRASNIRHCRQRIAAIEAGAVEPGDCDVSYYRAELAINLARPDRICTDVAGRSPHCTHTMINCPTCGNDGDCGVTMDAESLASTIRALRTALRAGAPA